MSRFTPSFFYAMIWLGYCERSEQLLCYYFTKGGFSMKLKRILALTGAFLLFAMYACTLIFAFMDSPAAAGLFKASIVCTVIVPVLLYGYALVYRITRPPSEGGTQKDSGSDNRQPLE